jgi:hypothetical protein
MSDLIIVYEFHCHMPSQSKSSSFVGISFCRLKSHSEREYLRLIHCLFVSNSMEQKSRKS